MWKTYFQKTLIFGALTSVAAFSYAQETKKDSIGTKNVEAVQIIGSRNKNRVSTDSPVPVDVLNISQLATAAPQTDLNQILNYIAPSFTSNTATVADGTDAIDPAQLRGLGPDQVLILLNGKRRHTSALVNVNGTTGRGSVGTDLNAIPAFAIERIEVLRDGASSQYGSDAIAGVMNVVMKRATGKLNLQLTSGGNISSNANDFSGGMDGEKFQLDANYGFKVAKRGFVNITGNIGWRNPTYRAGTYSGNAFNGFNAVEERARQNGVSLTGMFDNVSGGNATLNGVNNNNNLINAIHQYASQVGYFSAATQASIASANSVSALQSILKSDYTNQELAYRGLTRNDLNMRVGQSKIFNGQLYVNSEIPINDNLKAYWFGGYSNREGNSGGFYRFANASKTQTDFYPNGFLPQIGSTIQDFSLAGGIKGKVGSWNFDLSNTYGQNTFDYTIKNTSNATQAVSSNGSFQNSFSAGGLGYSQNTVNLDLSKNYDVLSGLSIAFGSELRFENYKIKAGETSSWEQYNTDGSGHSVNPTGTLPTDFFGSVRPGGSQVFPGFRPENAVNKGRHSFAFYTDNELDITDKWLVAAALRYEDYSDFGSTFNYKFATRYKLPYGLALRGSLSSGFRAPSLAQKYFNSISTIFVSQGGQTVATENGLFRNDSNLAQSLGIPQLKQETSNSYSAGLTWKIPSTKLQFTVDGYYTKIKNRIVMTGSFTPNPTDASLFGTATTASFFANAIDTQTKGVDAVLSNKKVFENGLRLNSDLAFSYSQTNQVGSIHASPKLTSSSDLNAYFGETSRIYLSEAVPKIKGNFSNSLTYKKWNAFLRESYFGKVTDPGTTDLNGDGIIGATEHPVYGGKFLTDLSFGYEITKQVSLTVGANNIFDTYPDRNPVALNSNQQFIYSRAVSQFGFNGRFVFARLNLNF
jgi:iron complex outermembrane receptor protein